MKGYKPQTERIITEDQQKKKERNQSERSEAAQHTSIFRHHRMVWLEGPFKVIRFQLPCCGQRHLALDQCAQNPIQTGLDPSKKQRFLQRASNLFNLAFLDVRI